MLTIRKEQMELLKRHMASQFANRLVRQWRSSYPEATKSRSDAALLDDMKNAIQDAESHGITGQAEIERYAGFVMEYGASFGSSPTSRWAGAVLERSDLAGSEKLAAVEEAYLHEGRAGHG
jgi:hypothetical protein